MHDAAVAGREDREQLPVEHGPAGLHRLDGATFGPLQPNVDIGDGVPRAQISLTKTFDPDAETLGARFVAVLGWLRNPR